MESQVKYFQISSDPELCLCSKCPHWVIIGIVTAVLMTLSSQTDAQLAFCCIN